MFGILNQRICFQWPKTIKTVWWLFVSSHYPMSICVHICIYVIFCGKWKSFWGICYNLCIQPLFFFVANKFLLNCADRLDRANSLGNDLEKNQHGLSRSIPVTDHGDAGSNYLNENHYSGLVALEGCSYSLASQLLNDRMYHCQPLYIFFLHLLHFIV